MTRKDILNFLHDHGGDETVIFDNPSYDGAFIGISEDGRAVYLYDRMIDWLVEEDEMEPDEAADFIGYNTIRALPYIKNAPIIVYGYEDF